MSTCTALVALDRNIVDLSKLYLYECLSKEVLTSRAKYANLLSSIQTVCNLYADNHTEVQSRIKTLRRSIRNLTKGQTLTDSLDSITDSFYLENTTEQLYVANSVLLKSTYRKLASLVHPDKQHGCNNLFIAVNAAYRNKDLVFLQQLYVNMVNSKNLFWVQTLGMDYVRQELERPTVSLTILVATSPLYSICQLHVTGNVSKCSALVLTYLLNQEVNLLQEYNSLLINQYSITNQ